MARSCSRGRSGSLPCASLAVQVLLVVRHGGRVGEEDSQVVSIVLGGPLVGYVSAGVVRARRVTIVVASVVVSLGVVGGIADLVSGDDVDATAYTALIVRALSLARRRRPWTARSSTSFCTSADRALTSDAWQRRPDRQIATTVPACPSCSFPMRAPEKHDPGEDAAPPGGRDARVGQCSTAPTSASSTVRSPTCRCSRGRSRWPWRAGRGDGSGLAADVELVGLEDEVGVPLPVPDEPSEEGRARRGVHRPRQRRRPGQPAGPAACRPGRRSARAPA